jgi:transcriptional regulator with XRE-family HTH domain
VELGALIADARSAAGMSQGDLAAELSRVAGRDTVDRTVVRKWENGKMRPGPFWLGHLASVLEVPIGVLRRAKARNPEAPPVGTVSLDVADHDWEEFGEVERRRFLAVSAASALGSLGIADPAELTRPGRTSPRVSAGDVEAMRRMVQVFGDAGAELGGGHLLRPTLQYILSDVDRQLAGTYTEAVGRELAAAAAEITHLGAWMAQDAGREDAASHLYGRSRSLAGEAGDAELAATALRGLASQAGDRRDSAEAVRIAEECVYLARSLADPKARAYYSCTLATAASMDGDKPLALSALADSAALIERANATPGMSWASHYSPGRWAHEAGLVLARVGELDAAAEHMHLALEIHGLDRRRTRAMVLADLAVVQLKQGATDGACATWREFLGLADGIRSVRVDDALRDMVSRLTRVGGPEAEALREQAESQLR